MPLVLQIIIQLLNVLQALVSDVCVIHKKNMKDEFKDYELILEIHNAGDQTFIKSILDAEGITYYIQGEHIAPYIYHALPMRLMVEKDQAKEVREILKDVELSSAYEGLGKIKDNNDDE